MTLFHDGAEAYASDNSSLVSKDIQAIAEQTEKNKLFSPCMVGSLESQFLKMQMQISGAKKVLDVGTFTGMSALAMAEGIPEDGNVITLENDEKIAAVAQECFDKAANGHKITLMKGQAADIMQSLLEGS